MTVFHYRNVLMQNIIPKVDELKVSWDDSFCKFIHKNRHKKCYHSDIIYHATKYSF